MIPRVRTAVLISGRGSNMSALIEAARAPSFPAEIVLVLSDEPAAAGLPIARDAGVAAEAIDYRAYPGKEAFEAALDARLLAASAEIVCLAGFMRLVGAPLLEAFLDAELARHSLGADRLILLGFSQGAMMALHVGLRRETPPVAIIAHSGMLVDTERLAAEIRSRPPVLLTHGADDDILPAANLPVAKAALEAAGVPVEAHLVPNLSHGIDETTLRIAITFLARTLSGRGAD